MFQYIFTGGFLAGYRTYVISAVAVTVVAAQYVLGDIGLAAFIEQAAIALGLSTVRAGAAAAVAKSAEDAVKAAMLVAKP